MPDVDGAGLIGDHMEPETHRLRDYRSNTPVPESSGPSGTVHSVRNVKRCDNTIPAPTRFCAVYPGAPEGPSS
ncbi:uncharacterized protein N7518_009894 [Penicillium psychrosexuale]|uniref:uncharacterized protein n=1 Tax=Penicillium psychrosexuale TaxID=1002107 RepID=UPI00254540B5|nr:uncharacterized protein N7518_009894 [Penicillium psychrosexuale]KAJ5781411.1 hypothetical protein N7518_009894 [Penicillium psychrosexuale]